MKPHILYIVGGEVTERHGPWDVRTYHVASRGRCTCGRTNCRHARAVAETRERNARHPNLYAFLVNAR